MQIFAITSLINFPEIKGTFIVMLEQYIFEELTLTGPVSYSTFGNLCKSCSKKAHFTEDRFISLRIFKHYTITVVYISEQVNFNYGHLMLSVLL